MTSLGVRVQASHRLRPGCSTLSASTLPSTTRSRRRRRRAWTRECGGSPGRPTTRGCGSAARRSSPPRAARPAGAPRSEASRPSPSRRPPRISCSSRSRGAGVRIRARLLASRRARVPGSSSFPSGHAASAFAFATGVGSVLPVEAIPIRALASLVAYSRRAHRRALPGGCARRRVPRHDARAGHLPGPRTALRTQGQRCRAVVASSRQACVSAA